MAATFDHLSDEEYKALEKARTAYTLGLLAMTLCLMVMCGGCVTLFFALPMSGFATYYARQALAGEPNEVTRVYAQTAMYTGVVAMMYSLLLLSLLFLYIMIYVGMFGMIIATS